MFDNGPRLIGSKHQIFKPDGLDPEVVSRSVLDRDAATASGIAQSTRSLIIERNSVIINSTSLE